LIDVPHAHRRIIGGGPHLAAIRGQTVDFLLVHAICEALDNSARF
jgi:hypothetical protein